MAGEPPGEAVRRVEADRWSRGSLVDSVSGCVLGYGREVSGKRRGSPELLWPFRFHGHRGLLVWMGDGCFSAGVRVRLAEAGHRLLTDDPGGVLAKLIEHEQAGALRDALNAALAEVHGDYAVIVAMNDPTDTVIGAARGHRMIAMQDEHWTMLSTDEDLIFRRMRAEGGQLVAYFDDHQQYEVAADRRLLPLLERCGRLLDDQRLLTAQTVPMDHAVSLEARNNPKGYHPALPPWSPPERDNRPRSLR